MIEQAVKCVVCEQKDKIMSDKYILKGKETIPCDDLLEWGQWLETNDRSLAKTMVGRDLVSTLFLGLDHSYTPGPPILFETMVFGGLMDGEQQRYQTYESALIGHEKIVKEVKNIKRWKNFKWWLKRDFRLLWQLLKRRLRGRRG